MIRRIAIIVCVVSISLLCGCSGTSTINSESDASKPTESVIEASNTNKDKYTLNDVIICYKGHYGVVEHITKGNYDLTKCTMKGETSEPHTIYRISEDGTFSFENSYDYCSDDVKCQFSKEKSKEIFDCICSCNLQEYEIYHSNTDGVMVTEYPEYYIYDVASDKAYVLPKKEYMEILDKMNELKIAAEKSLR